MAISKAKARSVKNAVLSGDEQSTKLLDGLSPATTISIVELTGPASKVSIQTSGTLVGTAEFSINGSTFYGSTALIAGAPISYSTHNTSVIRITQTSGSGRASIIST